MAWNKTAYTCSYRTFQFLSNRTVPWLSWFLGGAKTYLYPNLLLGLFIRKFIKYLFWTIKWLNKYNVNRGTSWPHTLSYLERNNTDTLISCPTLIFAGYSLFIVLTAKNQLNTNKRHEWNLSSGYVVFCCYPEVHFYKICVRMKSLFFCKIGFSWRIRPVCVLN